MHKVMMTKRTPLSRAKRGAFLFANPHIDSRTFETVFSTLLSTKVYDLNNKLAHLSTSSSPVDFGKLIKEAGKKMLPISDLSHSYPSSGALTRDALSNYFSFAIDIYISSFGSFCLL